jgi:hypothetical protein
VVKGKRRPPLKIIDGYSESLWKSLVVKSLRIGWPAGLRAAAERLTPSTMKDLLLCGVFEDIFPAESELADVIAEVEARDYEALCARETHHGRGYTERFCDMSWEAVEAARDRKPMLWAEGKARGVPVPYRALNCWYTWLVIRPQDAGVKRAIDEAPWEGMPAAMADGHTYEVRQTKTRVTVVSGHYHQHRALGGLVRANGWAGVRGEVHAKHIDGCPQPQMMLI